MSGKRIIGTVEKVKVVKNEEEMIDVEAKIDTGAASTSIDTELARKIGFGAVVEAFFSLDFSSYKLVPENESYIKKDILKKYQEQIPGMEDVAVVFSSSGSTIRPVVKIEFMMDKERVVSKVNIVNRKHLKYPMIIGKKDLKKFLIEVK